MSLTVAIMQPAFIPPASYFRLFAATDLFICLDTVQFDRRWYTHRQQLTNRSGSKDWFTLPILHTSRDETMIRSLQWRETAADEWDDLQAPFPVFDTMEIVNNFTTPPAEFVLNSLLLTCFRLKIKSDWKLASDIHIPYDLRGKDRIIALCKAVGATRYINSPGGKTLYDHQTFEDNGIELDFLPEYNGSNDSIIERFGSDNVDDIHAEIMANL